MPASAANTINVAAGSESADTRIQGLNFAPSTVTVNVGDTVTWKVPTAEFHTVTFTGGAPTPPFVVVGDHGPMLNPAVGFPEGGKSYDGSAMTNSGLLNTGDTYALTFTKAGTYNYVCAVHSEMKGTIVVKDAGQPADSQASVDARAAAENNALMAQHAVPILLSNSGLQPTEASTEGLAVGAGDKAIAVMSFLPTDTKIHVGDSVTWINKDVETPHTVTFLGGNPAPEVVVPQPQPNGPPALLLNPEVLMPAGDPTSYDGGSMLNSGFMDPTMPAPGQTGAPAFTVTFAAPGTFDYVCLLHPQMKGTVTVLP